jgi:hypothetical protein
MSEKQKNLAKSGFDFEPEGNSFVDSFDRLDSWSGGYDMTGDSEYYVSSHDWPIVAHEEDLTIEQIYSVLDQFDQYYPAAVVELGKVSAQRQNDRNGPMS